MPSGFGTNLGYALAACPTKQSICGAEKFIKLDEMYDATLKTNVSQKTITVLGSKMIINDTCTWVIRSKCKAPYFKINKDNTMTSSKIKLNVLEWRESTVPSSTTIEDFRQNPFFAMPLQTTSWVDTSLDVGVKGRLGDVTILPEKIIRVAGDWIQYQMNNRREEFTDYNTNKVNYDKKKAAYNGSLRI
jgi:hypothetical protein